MNCYFITRTCCCLVRSASSGGHFRLQQHLPIRWNGNAAAAVPPPKPPPPPPAPAPKKTSKPMEAKIDVKIKEIISSMSKTERQMMYDQLRVIIYDEKPKKEDEESKINAWYTFLKKSSDSIKKYIDRPTMSQLNKLFLFHSMPYLAFGFMDNAIMIMCGDYIQATLGVRLGLSTLGSAGLGNAVADAISIGCAYKVEQFFSSFITAPSSLKLSHFELKSTRLVIQSARIIGIVIGCLLGLTPLFFIHA